MRKWINLAEAPIGDWTVDPDFDANDAEMKSKWHGYDRERNHWSEVDKKAMRDPVVIQRARSSFLNTPHKFNLYFWQSTDPDYDRTLQLGMVNHENLVNIMGDAAERVPNDPSTITVIMTNNLADEFPISIRSPWIVAHRIAHALMGGDNTTGSGEAAMGLFDEFVQQVLQHGYGLEWPDTDTEHGRAIASEYREIYVELMGKTIGTMRSARNGNIVQASEWKYETFVQYLLTRKIPLRPLPQEFDEGLTLTTDPKKLKFVNDLWATLPRKLVRIFERMLRDATGHVWME